MLAVEGGGMRGVVSGGMVAALEALGLRDGFDGVYGASVGAVSGAYLIAGQARLGVSVFYDELNDDRFIRLRRMGGPAPVVALDYALDEICGRRRRLDADRVLGADLPLHVVASCVTSHRAEVLSDFRDAAELFECLRATMRIPWFAGPPVALRGRLYLDAAIYESIPVRSAIDGGATDVLALLSRPKGSLRGPPSAIDRLVVAPHLRRTDARLASDYLQRWLAYRREVEALDADGPAQVAAVQLAAGTRPVAGFEKSRRRLLAGAAAGWRRVCELFGEAPAGGPQ